MAQAQDTKQDDKAKRKPVLSPEVSEFLHMLKSLESELANPPAPTR
jgi:hypothetical protein